ncbi:general substrate transporter [Apiospora kogelbergensis]|uniref:General substrate transporter n=1 Tax=Apiospora kogelbergensis TaxID=1337665 RepID=A0AAW0QL79_9PEZI
MASSEDLKGDDETMAKANTTHVEMSNGQISVTPVAQLSPWECVKENPKACLWSLYANVGTCMIGYENLVLSVCLSMPAFQMTFASKINGALIIPAYWQSLWNAMFNVMSILGSLAAGPIQDKFGRRAVFLSTIITASAGIAVAYISKDPAHYLGAKVLVGSAVGMSMVGTQTYVSEITPLPMRGLALSINTVMLNLGMLMGISSTFSRISIMDESAFRVVFAAGWAFPGLLAVGLAFAPESPYWLLMKGKAGQARNSLVRLSNGKEDIDRRIAEMEHSIETERRLNSEKVSFLECFRGTNFRRTRIVAILFYMQLAVGSVLSANAPYFLNQAGLPSTTVLLIVQVGVSMGIVSAVANIFLMSRMRYRALMFLGVGICVASYLVMGVAGALPRTQASLTAVGVALQFSSLSYGPAVGAAMAVAGEVPAARLRAKTLGIGNATGSALATAWMVVLPYLYNSDQANLGGNIGWIFFGVALVYAGVLYFDVPGTKGRTFEEIDIMFDRRVSARHFEKLQLEPEEGSGDLKVKEQA